MRMLIAAANEPRVPAAYSARLILHTNGSIASLVHVSTSEQLIPALRLVGFIF